MDLNKRSTPDNGLRGDGLGDLLEESLAEFGNMVLVAGWAEVKWFNNNGHHAKNNYRESEVFNERETEAPELHKRVQARHCEVGP